MPESCSSSTKQKLIVFKENRSKLTLRNPKLLKCTLTEVDGCAIKSGLRCDFKLDSPTIEYYIELKGQDLSHAYKQLVASIKKLSSDPKKSRKVSYVICTRSPMSSASIQDTQVRFMKDFNSKLIVKSSPFSTRLEG